MVSFKNRDYAKEAIPQFFKPYEIGNKVAQLIIMPYPTIELIEADELSATERGVGGHGHTGA